MKRLIKRDLNSIYTVNSAVQLVLCIVVAYVISEFRISILHVPFKSPLIILILILSMFGASALMTVFTKTEFDEVSRLTKSMGKVAAGDFKLMLETKSGIEEIQSAYQSFNTMTRELNSMEILQNDFVSNVSHEFKTPINVIKGYLTLLQDPSLSDTEKNLYINRIETNTIRLSELVGNMLLLSKLDHQMIVKNEWFSLDEQIRQCILSLEPKWTEKRIDIDIDLASVQFWGTPAMLFHVWSNLIDNAIKFNRFEGHLGIRMKKMEQSILVTVEDDGPGIQESERERIFEKFYQIDSSHNGEGNGLGLALVKRILDLNGGTVRVENRPCGGAIFYISLPIKSDSAEK